ncbi:hypothetical protein WJX72_002358 [[Myrmecia] bisecta]|uniref:Tryptophan-rich sensory protein n=1 Tax=[Myrmecia] bisecta TaxID=41462 RepID=A0AAW1Q665_9CHLO
MRLIASSLERSTPGLLAALPPPDWSILAAGAVVFGVQRLVPDFDPTWYQQLKKPDWTPPDWVFPTVWIPLKIAQSYALWVVCKKARSREDLMLPLSLFGTHLFLGNWWNVVFFGRHQLRPSLKWMAAFWASIAGTAAAFYPIHPLAGVLMVPTLIWSTIAAKLNYDIVKLNDTSASPKEAK